ncbi:MAG: hypothetical protein FWE82_02750 [Defluviitaleaceae bacterium]|nr:hypothetical protein [Defluviitaleaceae bacterium]
MKKGNFENSFLLTKFILRRERVISCAWIVLLTLIVVGLVPGMKTAIDLESLDSLLPIMEIPAMVAMVGPAYASITGTFGALYTNFMMLFTAITVALMNIFLVARYTRTDEERGRYEVVRSLPTGRLANLSAVMITVVIVNVVLSAVLGLGMYATGDESMCFTGSMLWGMTNGAVGLVFAALAALFCQLSSSSRGATGYSFMALGFLYLLRAPGDMNPDMEILARISPLGLALRTEAYIENNFWPIYILVAAAAVITAAAFYFNHVRDIDQGIIAAKPGRAKGSFLMKTPAGLSFKLLKSGIIVWLVSMFMLGASYSSVLGEIDEFIAQNDMYRTLILGPAGIEFTEGFTVEQTVAFMQAAVRQAGFTLPELFSAMINNIMSLVTVIALLIFILKAVHEERDIRAELIHAAPVSRTRYLAGYAAIAFVCAIVLQFALVIGLYGVAVTSLADPSELTFLFLLEANMVYVPALWVMIGVTVLLIGAAPKASGAIWGYYAYSFLVVFIGRLSVFPAWLSKLTPFGYINELPMKQTEPLTLAVLTAIAAALTALGIFFYNRRDINAITH